MGGCRGETAVQTPCLTAHYTSITTKRASLPLSFQRWPPHHSVGLGQPPARADVPTSSLSSSLKRQTIHYDPSLQSVYSVPIYHRCMDGMSPVLYTERNIPQDFKRKQERLFSLKETASGKATSQQRVSIESLLFNDRQKIYFTSLCFMMGFYHLVLASSDTSPLMFYHQGIKGNIFCALACASVR